MKDCPKELVLLVRLIVRRNGTGDLRFPHLTFSVIVSFVVKFVNLKGTIRIPHAGDVLCCVEQPNEVHKKSFKYIILETCDSRGDNSARHVRLRVDGAVSDLHAADGRYHYDCRTAFMAPRAAQFAASSTSGDKQHTDNSDDTFYKVVKLMSEDRTQSRNSLDTYELYKHFEGKELSRKQYQRGLSDDS